MSPLSEEAAARLASYFILILSIIFIGALVLEYFRLVPQARDKGAIVAGILWTVGGLVTLCILLYDIWFEPSVSD